MPPGARQRGKILQGISEVGGSEQMRQGIAQAEEGVKEPAPKVSGEAAKPERLQSAGQARRRRHWRGRRRSSRCSGQPRDVQSLFSQGDDVLPCAAGGIQHAEGHRPAAG